MKNKADEIPISVIMAWHRVAVFNPPDKSFFDLPIVRSLLTPPYYSDSEVKGFSAIIECMHGQRSVGESLKENTDVMIFFIHSNSHELSDVQLLKASCLALLLMGCGKVIEHYGDSMRHATRLRAKFSSLAVDIDKITYWYMSQEV